MYLVNQIIIMKDKGSDIAFIQEKIMDIGNAMFSTNLTPELYLFNNVIKTIKTDDDGNIWFFTSCKGEYAKNIIGLFFTRLDYYQKGRDFRLHITGESSIVETITDVDSSEIGANNIVLIKCKITYVEYVQYSITNNISFTKKASKLINDFFFSNSYRQFDFTSRLFPNIYNRNNF